MAQLFLKPFAGERGLQTAQGQGLVTLQSPQLSAMTVTTPHISKPPDH